MIDMPLATNASPPQHAHLMLRCTALLHSFRTRNTAPYHTERALTRLCCAAADVAPKPAACVPVRRYRRKHRNIDVTVLKRWAWQILQGLVYLVSRGP